MPYFCSLKWVRTLLPQNKKNYTRHANSKNVFSFVYEDTDITKALEKAVEKEPLFICNDEGTLDPQTGIYEIQSSGNS